LRRKIFRTLIALSTAIILILSEAVPVYAAAIDVGPGATDRASTWSTSDSNIVDKANVANDTGTLDTFEVWAQTQLTLAEMASFYVVSGDYLSTRADASIGTVNSGSKQTFTGLSVSVSSGDRLGIFFHTGAIELATTGGSGVWYSTGSDKIPCTNTAFSAQASYRVSIYATGTTPAGAAYIPKITWH
jgi:hypothetical protein